MKILILKPSSLGDVVHALPVLRLLKLHLPESKVFWWLETGLTPLLADDPDIAGIFSFERNAWATPRRWPQMWECVRAMRRERFDWALDLQGLARSGIFAWLANAGLVAGLDNPREGGREGARMYYDVVAPRVKPGTHAVDRYVGILPKLGVPVHGNFQWLPERPQVAARVREKWQTAGARWIVLLPGARWNTKQWPVEHFCELTKQVAPLGKELRFVILGGKDDCALGRTIAEADPAHCLDLTGQTSLPEMIEWIRLSELVITNDTGPMHIAAALGRRVVALFGPTEPSGTGPYGQRENVLQLKEPPCIPCMKGECGFARPLACLRDITPGMVLERVKKSLAGH